MAKLTPEEYQKLVDKYQRQLAQPVWLYRVDIVNSKTECTRIRFTATSDDEAKATALEIVQIHGADYGDMYRHATGDCVYIHHSIVGPCPDEPLTREDVLAAIVAGIQAEQALRDHFGIRLDRMLQGDEHSLFQFLHNDLLINDLIYMAHEFGTPGSFYKPTKKGRELVKARQGGAS